MSIIKKYAQFIKFCIVGASNALVSYLINVGVIFVLRNKNLSWDYILANVVAFILSVLWSFYWNSKYVFKQGEEEHRSLFKALIKMYITYGFTGIVLNNVLSFLWIDVLLLSKYVAPLLNSAIGVPINYVINKYWAFRE